MLPNSLGELRLHGGNITVGDDGEDKEVECERTEEKKVEVVEPS